MKRLAILALLAALFSALILTLRLETRLTVFFLGQETGAEPLLAKLQLSAFARRYLVVLEPRSGGKPELSAFAQKFIRRVRSLPGVEQVWPAWQPPVALPGLLAEYAAYAPLIYSLDPDREADQVLSLKALPRRAEELKRALLSPFGDLVEQIAPHDPLLLTFDAFADWRQRLAPLEIHQDEFYPIVLQSRFEPFASDQQRQLQEALRQAFGEINQSYGQAFRLRMTGVPVFAVAAQNRIQRDVNRVSLASSLGVTAVLLGLFRTWRSLPAILLVLALAIATGTLVTQWTFGYVHGLTLALGASLIGVCVDYPIHLLAHCRRDRPPAQVARRLWPALTLGAVTTVIGYLALAATGYPGFQQIAVFAAAGILTALLATRYLLPTWLDGVPIKPPNLPSFNAWFELCRRHRGKMLIGTCLLLLAALGFLPRLQWLTELERLAEIDPRLQREDRQLRARLSDLEPGRAVLVTGPDLETAIRRAEAATRTLRQLQAEGKLSSFQGIYPWLVSRALQQANWQHYRAHLTPEFIAAWNQTLAAQGLAVAPLTLRVPTTPPAWLEPEAVLGSHIEAILSAQIHREADGVHLAVWLGPHDPAAVAAALADLDGVRYFSQRDRINALARTYQHRAAVALGLGLVVILLVLAWRYRSLSQAFQMLVPSLVGMVLVLAGFTALNQPISFFHLLATALVVAICVDYGIFYTELRAGELLATYRAMGASMLTTITAFAALGLAENLLLKTLAVTVVVGVAAGFLLCPLLIAVPKRVELSR